MFGPLSAPFTSVLDPFGCLRLPFSFLLAPCSLPLASLGIRLASFRVHSAPFCFRLAGFWFPLARFYISFGSLWAPVVFLATFGCFLVPLWLPIGLLLISFCSFSVLFCTPSVSFLLPLGSLWYFGSLVAHFGFRFCSLQSPFLASLFESPLALCEGTFGFTVCAYRYIYIPTSRPTYIHTQIRSTSTCCHRGSISNCESEMQ